MAESNREEIAKLEALYANNPGGRVFTHLAEAYRKAGELDRARAILESGITRHPDYASAHVVLGRVLIDQGSLENAAMEFRRVLELDPENRVALRSLGDIARSSDPENALDHYRHLSSLDPADEELANTIANLESQVAASATAEPVEEPEPAGSELDVAPAPVEPTFYHAEPVQTAFAEPVNEPEAVPYEPPIQPSEADFGSWEPDSEEESLPGDLAHLARIDPSDDELTQAEAPPEAGIEEPTSEEPWAAPTEPAPADERWAAESAEPVEPSTLEAGETSEPLTPEAGETAEPWSTPEAAENVDPWETPEPEAVEPWATAEQAEAEDPWAPTGPETSEPWASTPEPDAAEPWASTPEPDTAEPWASTPEPDAAEPWASTPEPDAAEPWASTPEPDAAEPWASTPEPEAPGSWGAAEPELPADPWSVSPEPETPEPWTAADDGPGLDDSWSAIADATEPESLEVTLEVSGFISEQFDADAESTEPPGAESFDDRSAPLPEFSGFVEAADAILRPDGEPEVEVSERSETAEPSFEEMLSANLGAQSPLVRNESEDLPTETLAELYRTQGFFGRAADVYRALLTVSPDDTRLRGLLREVEELEHSPMEAGGERILELDAVVAADDELSARVAASAEESGPPEAWLETVESAWTGGSGAADLDDAHYAWAHDSSEESASGVSLQDYLKTLLAWRPAESADTSTEEPEPTEEDEGVSESFAYTVPGDTAQTEISPPPEPAASSAEGTPVAAFAAEPVDPWEQAPTTQAPLSPVTSTTTNRPEPPRVEFARPTSSTMAPRSSGNAVDDAFEEWFGGGVSSTPAQPVGAPQAFSTGPVPSSASTPTADLDDDDEADDDLEVFRSWLQSLKR